MEHLKFQFQLVLNRFDIDKVFSFSCPIWNSQRRSVHLRLFYGSVAERCVQFQTGDDEFDNSQLWPCPFYHSNASIPGYYSDKILVIFRQYGARMYSIYNYSHFRPLCYIITNFLKKSYSPDTSRLTIFQKYTT